MLLIIFPLIEAAQWGCLRQLFKEHLDKKASLVAHVVKNLPAMQETQVPSLGWEDPLEKGMATHTSIVAWRIPWTEEPGGLQSMGHKESDTTEWLTSTLDKSVLWEISIRDVSNMPGPGFASKSWLS